MRQFFKTILGLGAAVALIGTGLVPAHATEGYFGIGYGARHKALGGAGLADPGDATIAAINPAGIVMVDDQLTLSVSVFSPRRSFTATEGNTVNLGGGPFPLNTLPVGQYDSERNFFFIPNFSWTKRVNQGLVDTLGVTVYGNGGMNTTWPDMPGSTFCRLLASGAFGPGTAAGTGTGAFCFGAMGVNLEQAIMAVSFAKKLGNVSIGVSPLIARQQIELDGLGLFAGLSTRPGNVTNQGVDVSWGYGIRAGVIVDVSPNIRVAASAASKMYMGEFNKYSGLFAEQGDFDIPAHIQIGVSVDVTPNLTISADYKRIWYSQIASIANPSTNIYNCTQTATGGVGPGCLGADGGAGFGWKDVDIFKIGAEMEVSDTLTLRAGYSYNTNPIGSRDVMFNVIAPGVVQHHFTAGAKMKVTENLDLELSGMYVPSNSVRGTELDKNFGGTVFPVGNTVDIEMYQWEITAGLVWHFGAPEEPLK